MKNKFLIPAFLLIVLSGCASSGSKKIPNVVVWETMDIQQGYDVLGPVAVEQEFTESSGEVVPGLAGKLAIDGRVTGTLPPDVNLALREKSIRYKDRLFNLMAQKAKSHNADAVIGAWFAYIPPYLAPSGKSIIKAKGLMIKYK